MGRETRTRRTPINGKRNVLTVRGGNTDDFEYRVVNDVGDRVAQFEEQGYEIVTDPKIQIGDRRIANPTKEGAPIRVSVGGGMQAYVMRQKKEFYNEDKAAKAAHVDKTEGATKADARKSADYGKLKLSIGE
jgi:hypothetical protein